MLIVESPFHRPHLSCVSLLVRDGKHTRIWWILSHSYLGKGTGPGIPKVKTADGDNPKFPELEINLNGYIDLNTF